MLAPWQREAPIEMSRADLDKRAGRTLTDDDLRRSPPSASSSAGSGRHQVAVSQLGVGLGLLDLGYPIEAARAAAEVYAAHGRAIAEELYGAVPDQGVAGLQGAGRLALNTIQEVVERLKPLSIASLVQAYEAGMDATRRAKHRQAGQRMTVRGHLPRGTRTP